MKSLEQWFKSLQPPDRQGERRTHVLRCLRDIALLLRDFDKHGIASCFTSDEEMYLHEGTA